MNPLITLLITLVGIAIGAAIGYFVRQYQYQEQLRKEQMEAGSILQQAKSEAQEIRIKAQEDILAMRQKAEQEIERRRDELDRLDQRLQNRRDELDRRAERLERTQENLNRRQSSLDRRFNELKKAEEKQAEELQRIAQMTMDEARQILLEKAEQEAREDMARIIRQIEAEARDEGEKRARKLIADAIQRVASEHVSEVTTKVVNLPSDDMKGRIIGRNGRNIKAFEQAAGVDVIVDDTPEAITISSFDPVRREVARRAMEKLILDGRIHPAYIEKVLRKEAKEVERIIEEAGEQAAYDAGITGLHPAIIKMMGRLKFRTSYGQNQLDHAVETAKLATVIASELGADVTIAKTAAFLHDIGKAMDHEIEGTHASIGAEFIKRYGVHPLVVNAVAAHHHEVEQQSVEAVIAEAADAISGARPGARRESLEQYIKRVRALEEVATARKGVEEC
ncbi:MAG: ribonuclease Y, partial [Anaerolineae bacterium]